MGNFPVETQMLTDMQIRAAYKAEDVLPLLWAFDELGIAGQVHTQPGFAAQR